MLTGVEGGPWPALVGKVGDGADVFATGTSCPDRNWPAPLSLASPELPRAPCSCVPGRTLQLARPFVLPALAYDLPLWPNTKAG